MIFIDIHLVQSTDFDSMRPICLKVNKVTDFDKSRSREEKKQRKKIKVTYLKIDLITKSERI